MNPFNILSLNGFSKNNLLVHEFLLFQLSGLFRAKTPGIYVPDTKANKCFNDMHVYKLFFKCGILYSIAKQTR